MEKDAILQELVSFRIFPQGGGELAATRTRLYALWAQDLHQYIWHESGSGAFELSIMTTAGQPPHLHGEIATGDSIEDEWFLTHLLLRATQEIPGLAATVCDADGDFILIEAAEHLPAWLEPETSSDRVFLYRGVVHILDDDETDTIKVGDLSLGERLEFLRRSPSRTEASPAIQNEIRQRVASYAREAGVAQHHHHARIVLPARVASLLRRLPQSITPIMAALGSCTASELLHASWLRSCRDASGALNLVSSRVAFTRLHYAKLLCTRLHPPKGYVMPPEDSPDFTAHLLGARLALGLELAVLQDSQITRLSPGAGTDAELVVPESLPVSRLLEEASGEVEEYFGPDDDLAWMNVEEGPVLNGLAQKLDALKLSPEESQEIVNQMLEEEANPQLSDRLLSFMKATSGLDGIVYDGSGDDDAEGFSSDGDDDAEDFSSDGDDDDDDSSHPLDECTDEDALIEAEIIETIMHDPDLLMKIVERSDDLGLDLGRLLEQLKNYVPPPKQQEGDDAHQEGDDAHQKGGDTHRGARKQKGLADIDPIKLAEARSRVPARDPSRLPSVDPADGSPEYVSQSSEEDEELLYPNESEKPAPSSPVVNIDPPSSPDDDNYDEDDDEGKEHCHQEATMGERATISEFMLAMDEELRGKSVDRRQGGASVNLTESLKADASPAHSLLITLAGRE